MSRLSLRRAINREVDQLTERALRTLGPVDGTTLVRSLGSSATT